MERSQTCILLLTLVFLCKGLCNVSIKPSMNPICVGQNVTFSLFPPTVIKAGIWSYNGLVIVMWFPDSKPQLLNTYENRVTFNSTTNALTHESVTLNDSGLYVLQGFIPSIMTSITLSVLVPVSNVTVKANSTDLIEFCDSVSILCSAAGSSLTFHWLNGSSYIAVSDHVQLSDDNRTLTISSVSRHDTGPMYCMVSNAVSNASSKAVLFDIRYGPSDLRLTIMPREAAYRTGTDLSLSCFSQSNPPASYQWDFNGKTLNQNSSSLILQNVRQNQTGNYTCWVYNNVTLRSGNVGRWIVIMEPISRVNLNYTGPQPIDNQTFTLKCTVSQTVHSILWLKDDWPLYANERITFSKDNSSVTFSPVQLSDNGIYLCEAHNAVSNKTSPEFQLLVNFGPEEPIITGPAIAEAGSGVTLNCTASSQPPSQYTWYFNGTKVAQGPVYKISALTSAKSGLYTCVAFNSVTGRNSSSEKELTVIAAISSVMVRPSSKLPIQFSNLTLTCDVTGPAIAINWLKGGQPIHLNNTITLLADNSSVFFSPVQKFDDGSYQCVATSLLNNKTSPTYLLLVNYGPENPEITGPTEIKAGVTVNLTCFAYSQPPSQYYWIFEEDAITVDSQLTIHNPSVLNEGQYTCVARNPLLNKTSSATVSLRLVYPSAGPPQLSGGGLAFMILVTFPFLIGWTTR